MTKRKKREKLHSRTLEAAVGAVKSIGMSTMQSAKEFNALQSTFDRRVNNINEIISPLTLL